MIYTHLIQFESNEYHSAVAEKIDEAGKLVEAGFEYVWHFYQVNECLTTH
jgi:hypothetical protein